jgi:N-acetylneuraminic acid mutarotase
MKLLFALLFFPLISFSQWQELNAPGMNVPGNQLPLNRETSCYFSAGSTFYYGLGSWDFSISAHYFDDFFTYDIITNKWSRKNSIAFGGRDYAFSSFINGKGYIALGSKTTGGISPVYNDCWEYDTLTDAWTQKADFPGIFGVYSCGFANSTMLYILSTRSPNAATSFNDLYQYDPSSNVWILKNTPPFTGRINAATFTIGNNSYVTGGSDSLFNFLTDLWMYEPSTDSWLQKTDCPASAYYRTFTAVAAGHCWMMRTYNDSLLDYDPVDDTWTKKKPVPNLLITATYSDTNAFYVVNNSINVMKYDIAADSFITICPFPIGVGGNSIVMNQHGYDRYGNVYDFATDSWTVDNIIKLYSPQWTFAINDTGYGFFNGVFSAYDPISLTIIPKAAMQTTSSGFAIFGKGYVLVSDTLWQYDTQADQWNQKMIFPGGLRYTPSLMAIGNNGYLYSGYSPDSGYIINDFWKYDPVSDMWTQKTALPAPVRENCLFAGGNFTGYIGNGSYGPGNYYGDLWEYNPATYSWASISNPIGGFAGGFSFIYNDHLYLGGGAEYYHMGDFLPHYNFYRYTSSIITSANEPNVKNEFSLFPNVVLDHLRLNSLSKISSLEIYNMQGLLVYKTLEKDATGFNIDVENFASGIYIVRYNGTITEKFIKQ